MSLCLCYYAPDVNWALPQSALLPHPLSAFVFHLALWRSGPALVPFQTCLEVLDQIFA